VFVDDEVFLMSIQLRLLLTLVVCAIGCKSHSAGTDSTLTNASQLQSLLESQITPGEPVETAKKLLEEHGFSAYQDNSRELMHYRIDVPYQFPVSTRIDVFIIAVDGTITKCDIKSAGLGP